jgi:hypothetical protein
MPPILSSQPEARGSAGETQMKTLESLENPPNIYPKTTKHRPTIRPEST